MMIKGGYIFTSKIPVKHGEWRTFYGDALGVVSGFADCSIDCWITSPPYFNQFSYGVDNQVGLEATVADYMAYMEKLAKEMLRASKSFANLFWVVRDSFNGSGGLGGDYSGVIDIKERSVRPPLQKDLPRKSQLLVPERTRIGFSKVGWVPVLDVIWDKKDARRGSHDRPSYSYEHVLIFAASPRHYWNRDAVLTPFATSTKLEREEDYTGKARFNYRGHGIEDPSETKRRMIRSMKERPGAYLKSVWAIPSGNQPSITVAGKVLRAFTAFPELLAEICVNLGSKERSVVVDPFCGFGTTLLAAYRWGRDAIGIDINLDYLRATEERLRREVENDM